VATAVLERRHFAAGAKQHDRLVEQRSRNGFVLKLPGKSSDVPAIEWEHARIIAAVRDCRYSRGTGDYFLVGSPSKAEPRADCAGVRIRPGTWRLIDVLRRQTSSADPMCLGDAGLVMDPVTGQGISLALRHSGGWRSGSVAGATVGGATVSDDQKTTTALPLGG
jgi:hypothetical protein